MKTCCNHQCNEGRTCPAREAGNFYPATPEPLPIWQAIAGYCVIATLSVISFYLLAAGAASIYLNFFN